MKVRPNSSAAYKGIASFTRTNNKNLYLDTSGGSNFRSQRKIKITAGFGTSTNASDPNAMIDQGRVRNAVYNLTLKNEEEQE